MMVLRDMGNGVIRVESARMVQCPGRFYCTFEDAIPVLFPLSPRIQDCVEASMELSGGVCQPPFQDGLARSVCDGVTEVWLW